MKNPALISKIKSLEALTAEENDVTMMPIIMFHKASIS